MFGGTISFGGDPEVDRAYAAFRRYVVQRVQQAKGITNGGWAGPGSEPGSGQSNVSTEELIPDVAEYMTLAVAEAADSDRQLRAQLVGAGAMNDVPIDDMNPYVLTVLGAVERLLGRPSPECRKMGSALGEGQHEMLGDQHVRNGRYAAAEEEFRLARQMALLSPDGREISTSLKLADMMRVQGRHAEARQLFRETFARFERLDPACDFYDMASHIAGTIRPQLVEFLKG